MSPADLLVTHAEAIAREAEDLAREAASDQALGPSARRLARACGLLALRAAELWQVAWEEAHPWNGFRWLP